MEQLTMSIKVIEQSTSERKEEIKQIFERMKPLLDNGGNFYQSALEVTGRKSVGTRSRGWYRDLTDYAKSQGYDYKDYQWKRTRK